MTAVDGLQGAGGACWAKRCAGPTRGTHARLLPHEDPGKCCVSRMSRVCGSPVASQAQTRPVAPAPPGLSLPREAQEHAEPLSGLVAVHPESGAGRCAALWRGTGPPFHFIIPCVPHIC